MTHDALLPRTPQALLSRIQAGLHSRTRAATPHTADPGRHVEGRGQAQGACRRSRPFHRLCWTSGGCPSALECPPPLMRLHRCGAHCGSEVHPAYTAYPALPLASCHGTWRLQGLCGRRWGSRSCSRACRLILFVATTTLLLRPAISVFPAPAIEASGALTERRARTLVC